MRVVCCFSTSKGVSFFKKPRYCVNKGGGGVKSLVVKLNWTFSSSTTTERVRGLWVVCGSSINCMAKQSSLGRIHAYVKNKALC